ncbi:MAG TPA: hypothetical protein V6D20_09175 [Candidatus Obscuribacterales bacterium]
MISFFGTLFGFKDSTNSSREASLSNQVDHLEFELAKVKREREALEIRLQEERKAAEQHRLHNYPASSWGGELSNQDLFDPSYPNPIEYVLADVTALGYDVSAAWMAHRATLEMIAKYQIGVAQVLNTAGQMRYTSGQLRQ